MTEMQQFTASAPATFMIAGEHAVLYGQPALVGAIDKRLSVTLIPRRDNRIEIQSERLGHFSTSINDLQIQQPFHFVLGVLAHYQSILPTGCELIIESEFSHQVGFGSSAAITVATLYVLHQWLGFITDPHEIFRQAQLVVQRVQGVGSGADVAASVFGGIVAYQLSPLSITPISNLNKLPPLHLVYIGYKTPTAEVVQLVRRQYQTKTVYYHHLFEQMGACASACQQAIVDGDYLELGHLFKQHQSLQVKLGVSTEEIDHVIQQMQELPGIYGSKISGSGLGDCILCLGSLPQNYFPITKAQQVNGVRQFELKLTTQGVIPITEAAQRFAHG